MKRGLLSLVFLLAVIITVAQNKLNKNNFNRVELQDILQEGRDKIADQITSDRHYAALQTFKKLTRKFGEEHVILYPQEELLFALATRNFEMFIDSALHYDPVIDRKMQAYIFEDFWEEMYAYTMVEIMQISGELEQSDLTSLEKEIIKIYIQFLFSEDGSVLNRNIRQFKRDYSRKLFEDLFNSMKRHVSNSRLNFSLGYSYEGIGNGIDESLYYYLNFTKLELDGFIKKTYFSLHIGGGFSYLDPALYTHLTDIPANGVQQKANSLKYGVKLGRLLYSSNSLRLYPYLSAGGYEISPPNLLLEQSKILAPSQTIAHAFYAGAGISADIVLKQWKPKRMYEPQGYFFIRPSFGYNQFISEVSISRINNLYVSVSLGVSIGSK